MFVLGITGSIGSGKSTVSSILRERGLLVLDADEISRSVTAQNGEAIDEIEEVFGSKAIRADRSLNRKYMSDLVFADNKLLDVLSSIVHKHVFIVMHKTLEEEVKKKTKCVVLDVPIPVNKGFVDHCDQIWAVTCDDVIRLRRLIDRGMTKEDALRRIAVQMTNDEYAGLADFEIDNSGSMDDLTSKVEELIKSQLYERGIRI
ncbi:MAG: dephospho-CoA kinase [Saccharofermentans sp.]|nr:dephospho-CoA kinase [Saccharofermentans sp.]